MEGIIMTHPSVSEAIVIGVKDDIKGEIPIGLITIRDDDQLDRSHTLISKEIIALVRYQHHLIKA
jgi:propionyl-CoA synthetase